MYGYECYEIIVGKIGFDFDLIRFDLISLYLLSTVDSTCMLHII